MKQLMMLTLLLPGLSFAMSWNDLWYNKDQQGLQLLKENQAKQAAHTFKDPLWKGAALYKQGEYQKAADIYAKYQTPVAHYNRGNALAKLGQIDKAIAAYEQVLKEQPNHADAKYNKKLLEKLKKEMQKQQKQQQKQQQNQKDKKGQQDQKNQQKNQDKNQQPQNQNNQDSKSQGNPEQKPSHDQNQDQEPKDNDRSAKQKSDYDKALEKARTQAQPAKEKKEASLQAQPKPKKPLNQEMESQLQLIPDEPGNILKYKFQRDYHRRHHP